MNDVTYKLDELARAASISPRTVRYYVQRGLLPAPAFRGKDTAYGHEHLVRLRAIRRLQDAFFPLDTIAVELERRSLAEIGLLADGKEMPTPVVRQMVEVEPSVTSRRQPSARTFQRIELAPGVELSVAEDASPEARVLVERILEDVKRQGA